jgi:hypothetical protein
MKIDLELLQSAADSLVAHETSWDRGHSDN